MSKRKSLLAAGVVRDIRFPSSLVYSAYLSHLRLAGIKYQVLEDMYRDDGSVIARILSASDGAPLIKLFAD